MKKGELTGNILDETSLISVIVPVFRVERYIDKCVQSVVNQTYRNLEIILVDDGSPDNCGKMCELWSEKDHRIKVIHKLNGGLSDARNAGLAICAGKYVGFVDSDDYIEPEMYEKLLKASLATGADISCCYAVDELDGKIKELNKFNEYTVLDSNEAVRDLFITNDYIRHAAWNKLYKRELFGSIKFPVGRIYEDAAVMYRLIDKSSLIVCVNSELYHYIQRADSIIHAEYKRNSVADRFHNGLEAAEYFKEREDVLDAVFCWNALKFKDLWEEAYSNGDIEMCSEVYKEFCIIPLKSIIRQLSVKHKIKTLIFRISPKLYFRIRRLNNTNS